MSALQMKVVVIGIGLGGLTDAYALARVPVEVMLVDRNNHHLFQSLPYQVATAAMASTDIASPTRSIFARTPNVQVLLGEVVAIDVAARAVAVRDVGAIEYDQVVLALGAMSSWFGQEDWAHHSTALKTVMDGEWVRSRPPGAFERAKNLRDANEIKRLLPFVVVGGGGSDVELAASVRTSTRHTLPTDFRRIRPDRARVMVSELARLGEAQRQSGIGESRAAVQ